MTPQTSLPEVSEGEFHRLLGLPPHFVAGEEMEDLKCWARDWYEAHGNPWAETTDALAVEVDATGPGLSIDGCRLESPFLAEKFRIGEVEAVVLAVVSAGPEAEAEARERWEAEEPDRYYFLEVYASVVVQTLLAEVGERLCAHEASGGLAVLPPFSPGFDGWNLQEQPALWQFTRGRLCGFAGPLETLASGALRPKKSEFSVFGLSRRKEWRGRLQAYVPCQECALTSCRFRKAPYAHQAYHLTMSDPLPASRPPSTEFPDYAFKANVLRRWARDRLELAEEAPGRLRARFRLNGSTCSNMGQPLAMDYEVGLARRENAWMIERMTARPAAGDTGHQAMCSFLADRSGFLPMVAAESPLRDMSLDAALRWEAPVAPSGCLCTVSNRNHKWRMVLQTVHFALAQSEVVLGEPPFRITPNLTQN